MTVPTPAQAAAFNKAALSIALSCDGVSFSEHEDTYRATVQFEGYSHHGKATVVFDVTWFGKPDDGGLPTAGVNFLANGRKVMSLTWSDGISGDHARRCRHGRVDIADLFSVDGDRSMHETMEMLGDVFAKMKAYLESWMGGGFKPPVDGNPVVVRPAFPRRQAPGVAV